jgi:hypothetical protein
MHFTQFTRQQHYNKTEKGISTGKPKSTYSSYTTKDSRNDGISVFAASSATKEEEEVARKLRDKDPKAQPVETERKIWRPKVTSQYMEPDCIPDPNGDLEILFKDYGKPIWVSKSTLPPRDDLIMFSEEQHQAEFERNIQWRECPKQYKERIEPLLKKFWDVFAEEGVRKHIQGVTFHVDTGEATPICVKIPRYGPHESRVINGLVKKLEQAKRFSRR